MSLLDFFARSEWPIVALIVLWFLRRPIVRMLDRVSPTKVDAWGFKAEFERGLAVVELAAPTADGAVLDSGPPPSESKVGLPGAKVLDAWSRLENRTKQAYREVFTGVTVSDDASLLHMLVALGVDRSSIDGISELRVLRNAIAHGKGPPLDDIEAERYVALTDIFGLQVAEAVKRRRPKAES
jgi:hypothetical protein